MECTVVMLASIEVNLVNIVDLMVNIVVMLEKYLVLVY